jgi:hypothetical protein
MPHRRRSPFSPAARLILVFLAEATEAQSYQDVALGVKISYWHVRKCCRELTAKGYLTQSQDGRFPKFLFNRNYREAEIAAVPGVALKQEGGAK